MRVIAEIDSEEQSHRAADALMVALLRDLGYDEAMDIYEAIYKWYA